MTQQARISTGFEQRKREHNQIESEYRFSASSTTPRSTTSTPRQRDILEANQAIREAQQPFILPVCKIQIQTCTSADEAGVIYFIECASLAAVFAKPNMAFSSSHSDASKVMPEKLLQPFEETSGEGEMKSFDIEHPGADDNDADTDSRRSSTVEYEQEPFETYQYKAAQLCRNIGYGVPSKIERMKGGGYNRIIGLTFESGQQRDYVLRIPREALDEVEIDKIKDQVAVVLYLSQYDFLNIPVIAAFDTTVNNVLECQYVLQERIDGVAVQDVFYTLPLAEKLQITTAVAKTLLQLESVALERPGRLVGTGDLPNRSDVALTSTKEIKITGFANDPVEDLPLMEKQPLVSLIVSLLEIRKQRNIDWDEMVERCERLQAITKEMEAAGLMSNTDDYCVPWHWDLSAANIMINHAITTRGEVLAKINANDEASHQSDHDGNTSMEEATGDKQQSSPESSAAGSVPMGKWVVSGVLDWDDVMSVPLVLARKPPFWLWIDEDAHGSVEEGDRPGIDLTEDELLIKAHFDQTMAQGSPSYIDDAYHRGPLLRALATFAIYNFEQGIYWNRYDGFVKEWEEFRETLTHKL
ncbi:hypothetical protein N431DRAFT_561037 [Stipitochalara longipes BDJ]|nr:hypothetical protein N431DRAFT_561037 [Stipitochalara longipes BDJ]